MGNLWEFPVTAPGPRTKFKPSQLTSLYFHEIMIHVKPFHICHPLPAEAAALREAAEETSLHIDGLRQFHAYSDPRRDPRQHNISTVFTARARGVPRAGDDAGEVRIFTEKNLPLPLAFDHEQILRDYFEKKRSAVSPQQRTKNDG